MEELHKPVLLKEVVAGLQPRPEQTYLDLTAGYAGHASEILAAVRNYKGSVLVDRDEFAIEALTSKYPKGEVVRLDRGEKLPGSPDNILIVKSDFYNAAQSLIECGKTFDMILADFGVSSPQLDNAARGFSFLEAGPLDMRMDQDGTLTAETIVNRWHPKEIEKILMQYGQESAGMAHKHARTIVEGRPWANTLELANAIAFGKHASKSKALAFSDGAGKKVEPKKRFGRHPATQVFQAIRIAVNDELSIIERTLPLLPKLLNPGGRVAIITFHSLEDRLVKQYFKSVSTLGEESELEIVTKSPIVAGEMELVINPRARSAKLRIAVKK